MILREMQIGRFDIKIEESWRSLIVKVKWDIEDNCIYYSVRRINLFPRISFTTIK